MSVAEGVAFVLILRAPLLPTAISQHLNRIHLTGSYLTSSVTLSLTTRTEKLEAGCGGLEQVDAGCPQQPNHQPDDDHGYDDVADPLAKSFRVRPVGHPLYVYRPWGWRGGFSFEGNLTVDD